MPRPARAAAPVVEEVETEKDFTIYMTKPITAKMIDFATWLRENVGDIDNLDVDRIVALGPTLYHDFQASDFNKEQTAIRRQERAEAAPAAAAPAGTALKRGRAAAAPAPAAPVTRRGRAAVAPVVAPAPAAPKRRGRAAATAGAEPY